MGFLMKALVIDLRYLIRWINLDKSNRVIVKLTPLAICPWELLDVHVRFQVFMPF